MHSFQTFKSLIGTDDKIMQFSRLYRHQDFIVNMIKLPFILFFITYQLINASLIKETPPVVMKTDDISQGIHIFIQ